MSFQEPLASTLSLRQIGFLSGHSSEIEYVRFSPDGRHLVSTAEWDIVVLIWDVPSKTLLRKLTFTTGVSDLAFSPDGTCLAIAAEGNVTLWEATGKHCLEHVPVHAREVAFSPSGKELLLTDSQGGSFWDLAK